MRQKLGQHFLINPEVSQNIAAALELAAGETIIEVGPGHGELTQEIIGAIEEAGLKDMKMIAVEKDAELAVTTTEKFKSHPFLEITQGDILEFLSDEKKNLPKGEYKIAGNLPYYLTGYLLRTISQLEHKPKLSVFMVQKEVAERMTAKPPDMNRLAASVQFWAEPELLFEVPREDFNPPPEVDSAIVLLRTKEGEGGTNQEVFYETIRWLFAQPRKTIFNNLRATLEERGLSKEASLGVLKDVEVDPDGRPQDLSIQKISDLAKRMERL